MELDTALTSIDPYAYGTGYFENVKVDVEEAKGGKVKIRFCWIQSTQLVRFFLRVIRFIGTSFIE